MIPAVFACFFSAALGIVLVITDGDWIDIVMAAFCALGIWTNLWALAAALKRVRAS